MYLFEYDPFIYKFINTREYIIFEAFLDSNNFVDSKVNIYFSNKYFKSTLTLVKDQSDKNKYTYTIESYAPVLKQYLGMIEFSGEYKDINPCVNVQEFTVTKSSGMFDKLDKVIIDYRDNVNKLYFVGSRNLF